MAANPMSRIEADAERDLARVESITKRKRAEVAPALTVADLTGFASAELPLAQYAVAGLLPRKHAAMLGSHGGSGKSNLALTLCAHIACARSWAGLSVASGRAVFVSLEDDVDVVRVRLKRIAHSYQLDAGMIERNLVVLDGTSGDCALAAETVAPGIKAFGSTSAFDDVRKHVAGAVLIVIDNASDAFDANENDRRHVRAFMRLLAQLARENNAAVLLLAHVDKQSAKYGSAGNSYSGSTAWHNSARSRLTLVEAEGVIELRQEKNNLGRLSGPVRLVWDESGVLVPAGFAAAVPSARDVEDDAGVLAALRAAEQAGIDVPTGRSGPGNAHSVLATFAELPRCLSGAAGRDRFWASVGRLLKSGCASSEEFRNGNRKLRTRLRVADLRQCASAPIPPYPPSEPARLGAQSAPIRANSTTGAEPAQTGATGNDEAIL